MKSKQSPSRSGFSFSGIVVAIVALTSIGLVVWYFLPSFDFSSAEVMPLMHTVERGEFLYEITENGSVESASNVEIRCEVHARGQGGATIIEIVPEGTYVKPGDFLVQFDDSALETDLTKQEIVCNTSKAAVIKAETDLANAEIALKEYIEGTFKQEQQRIKANMAEAEEEVRKADDYYEYSKKLAKRGYITKVKLEGDAFAKVKANNRLEEAKTELHVLEDYTKQKMVNQLESAIKTAIAHLDSEKASFKLDEDQRKLLESQIEKCTIRAEEPGQVVYANETNRRGDREVIIEAGTTVRERQVIIRLPDPQKMQVAAKINEAKVTHVKEGMPVTIRLDAYPGREFKGVVEKVNEYPAAAAWWAGSVKEYEAFIKILGSPKGLKPGLTASVWIQVERLPDVIQVPVQSVFEHGKKHYCVVRKNNEWQAQEVEIGSTNDKTVVIKNGLEPGMQIVHGAFTYRDDVDLPEIPDELKTNEVIKDQSEQKQGEGDSSAPEKQERNKQERKKFRSQGPGSDGPGKGRPGGGGSEKGRPGADGPGKNRPGADSPGKGRPGADGPGKNRPGAGRSNMPRAGS
ncbi:MAG: efflux RND transporter periplasmic adaptor subunit [Pirellulales bacterium]|nr:efflux RND transporter periplasmic adaptor subunit [Pirellulales bacterium]